MPLKVQIISIIMAALAFSSTVWALVHFKLKQTELQMRGGDPELGAEVDALRGDLADMQEHTRAELAEMQERLDFAERMLTAGRGSQDAKNE